VPHFISEIGAGRQTGKQIDRPPLEPAAKRRIATPEWKNQICFRESPPHSRKRPSPWGSAVTRVFRNVVRVVGEADIRHFQIVSESHAWPNRLRDLCPGTTDDFKKTSASLCRLPTALRRQLPRPHLRVAECDGADRSAARYEAPNRAAAFFTSFGATQKIAP
jgi:hypothetical protein